MDDVIFAHTGKPRLLDVAARLVVNKPEATGIAYTISATCLT